MFIFSFLHAFITGFGGIMMAYVLISAILMFMCAAVWHVTASLGIMTARPSTDEAFYNRMAACGMAISIVSTILALVLHGDIWSPVNSSPNNNWWQYSNVSPIGSDFERGMSWVAMLLGLLCTKIIYFVSAMFNAFGVPLWFYNLGDAAFARDVAHNFAWWFYSCLYSFTHGGFLAVYYFVRLPADLTDTDHMISR